MIRVWDALVRSLHWLLAAGVIVAWCSGHWSSQRFELIHHAAGYLAAAVVVVRVVWGRSGERYGRYGRYGPHARYASFTQFVLGPRAVWAYARQLRAGHAPRYIGHNPLGGWMVVALLVSVMAASVTGYLATTDWLWGYEWLSDLHAALAWLIVLLVPVHLGGVVLTSIRQRENLVAAMLVGRKRAASGTDVADVESDTRQR